MNETIIVGAYLLFYKKQNVIFLEKVPCFRDQNWPV